MGFRQRRHIKPSERKALSFRGKSHDIAPGLWMFTEDLGLGLVPFRARRKDGFEVNWKGDSGQVEKALQIIRSIARETYQGDDESVLDAIRNITQEIAWAGRGCFEIIRHENEISALRFSPEHMFVAGSYIVQLVPRRLWAEIGKRINVLRRNDIWMISVPNELGGLRAYKRMLRALSASGRGLMPEFYNEDLVTQRGSYFDFQKYIREKELFEAKATRSWGWTRRDYSAKNWTEYALFHRTLKFRYSQAVLRDHIISELNVLFKRLGFECSFSLSGVTTPNEIAAEHVRMAAGEISFLKASQVSRELFD